MGFGVVTLVFSLVLSGVSSAPAVPLCRGAFDLYFVLDRYKYVLILTVPKYVLLQFSNSPHFILYQILYEYWGSKSPKKNGNLRMNNGKVEALENSKYSYKKSAALKVAYLWLKF